MLPRLLPLACALALWTAAPASAATTGGVNTGLPGSTCAPTDGGLAFTPSSDPGVTTGELGDAAPAYYEFGAPTGAYLGQAPKGVMLEIHGGGWFVVGPGVVAKNRPYADDWRARGWETVNLTYHACDKSLDDVVTFFDLVHAQFPDLPICADGNSAGGQLALMLSTRRSALQCVVTQGAPTDLSALVGATYYWAAAAFGTDGLDTMSPVKHASEIGARVLLSASGGDRIVPPAQATELAAALPGYADVKLLDPGTATFTHANVDPAALDDFHLRELSLVAPLTGDAPGECSLCNAGAGWSRVATSPTPAGAQLELNATNELRAPTTNARLADAAAVMRYTALGGTLTLKGTSLSLPAGTWRLQTCWGASGAVFLTWSNCAERDVTSAATSTQAAPTKTLSFARLPTPYSFLFYVNVDRKVNGAWQPYGRSWRGNDGSRFIVPALGTIAG